jgi:toxin-antitoxin system PIN domain toxin
MSGVIDTNLLLYAVNRGCPEHRPARAFLSAVPDSAGVWYVTEGIGYEFLRVATHQRVFDRPLAAKEALRFWDTLLSWPNVTVLAAGPRHWCVLREVLVAQHAPAGNLFLDLRTVALMREHGIRAIYTADADFNRFKEIDVINPLNAAPG